MQENPIKAEMESLDAMGGFIENEAMAEDAKVCINEMLYPLVPPDTTIREFEKVAAALYDVINDMWAEKLRAG